MDIWIPLAMIAIGLLAIILEIFLPAGGIIGIGGLITIGTGVVMSFRLYGSEAGLGVLIFTLVAGPVVIIGLLKAFPKSFVGRKLILDDPLKPVILKKGKPGTEEKAEEKPGGPGEILPGAEGKAFTGLRPSGTGLINGRKVSVVTRGDFIDKESRIVVVKVEGSRIVVKKI